MSVEESRIEVATSIGSWAADMWKIIHESAQGQDFESKVFFGKKVACGTCHRVGPDGGQIGPDLTKVGAIRAPADLLESILFPSSTIAQGYEPYLVLTKNGQSLTGVVVRRSAELLVVRDSSGKDWHLAKDRIEEVRPLTTSLMPEGLERALSRAEFRDLTAFLRGLK